MDTIGNHELRNHTEVSEVKKPFSLFLFLTPIFFFTFYIAVKPQKTRSAKQVSHVGILCDRQ